VQLGVRASWTTPSAFCSAFYFYFSIENKLPELGSSSAKFQEIEIVIIINIH
jgi:hypothetical protein